MHTLPAETWFAQRGWEPFAFQREAWAAYAAGESGLLNAPTGSGKTYALLLPILLAAGAEPPLGLKAIWITPIRALAREIQGAAERAIAGMGLSWQVAVRTGDTSSTERTRQQKRQPDLLITTPESLHLLLATKGQARFFAQLQAIVVDEWHELLGSKRGVQLELALMRLRTLRPTLRTWGISATIGNLEQALDILLGDPLPPQRRIIRAVLSKKIEVHSLFPEKMDEFPWAGHLGIKMLSQVLPLIEASRSTLIFTNTRAQCEIWYQQLLEAAPELAGALAMHHGSISRELRDWVEEALHAGTLKAVVCTSSLDLGVDFRPVETVIQVGSAKGVARFLQRAGRSGHQPGATSRLFFVPTHGLELLEGAALRTAIAAQAVESRQPYERSFDVLAQYLITLAVGDGFRPEELLPEVRRTRCFRQLQDAEWQWLLNFITTGGASLQAYPEYRKVVVEGGVYRVLSRRTALWHRLQMGTIVGETNLPVKFVGGGYLGSIEEYFVAQLKPGDVFWFAGRSLELVRLKDMTVQVRLSSKKTGRVPSWQGGRLPLSSELSVYLRELIDQVARGVAAEVPELVAVAPILRVQQARSRLPRADELLVEQFQSREGYHLLLYPLEGRAVHEGLGALLAYRLGQLRPLSFSIAMNDYGLELLADQPIPFAEALAEGLFSPTNLRADIAASINATELSKRRFRDIASIAGLVFKGYPGKQKKERHVQASAQLFFEVFKDYEPEHLLLQQALDEVLTFQLEEARLRVALERMLQQRLCLEHPKGFTPFAFPILVDRLRARLSTEKLEDRIRKMTVMRLK